MRFCPFCSAENNDEQGVCTQCGRRLPPLPPRRRNAPPTGVQLPPRAPIASVARTPAPAKVAPPPAAPQPFDAGPTTVAPPQFESGPTVIGGPSFDSGATQVAPEPEMIGELTDAATVALPPPVRAGSPTPTPTQASTTAFAGAPPVARAGSPSTPPPLRRPAGTTNPPPIPGSGAIAVPPARRPGTTQPPPTPSSAGIALPGTIVTSNAPAKSPTALTPPHQIARDSAPALPPPPPREEPTAMTRTIPTAAPPEDKKRSLLSAISPSPAAARREPPPPEPRDGGRRSEDAPRPPAKPQLPVPSTNPVIPKGAFGDDFNTRVDAEPIVVEPTSGRAHQTGDTPPPTRLHRAEAHADRPFTPPKVDPVPEIPEPGLYNAARYTIRFTKAKYQRRGAIKTLSTEIKQDTEALDQVLGALGKVARTAKVEGRVFSAENAAIDAAEERIGALGKEHADVDGRKAEENSKFVDVERERNTKLSEAEKMVDEVTKELAHLEAQRRGLRDKRKELERRQKAYLRSAEDNDKQAGNAQMGDARAELRRSAEQHRKEAAALEPERQDVDRRLASLERPIGEATARLDAAKAELDAAKRSLSDAREGHTHRLAELDAEQKRKSREIGQAESEVQRRLVTLGTLVNLNRIDDPRFGELYQRIDRLRGAITARTTEIEKLTAEREAYDRGTLVRGVAVLGGAVIALIALIVILKAVL